MLRVFTVSGGTLAMVAVLVLGASGGARLETAVSPVAPAHTLSEPSIPPPPGASDSTVRKFPPPPRLLEGKTRTTLDGDDINDAVATYGIDDAGNLYEVHSPHTEVPSLGGPKT